MTNRASITALLIGFSLVACQRVDETSTSESLVSPTQPRQSFIEVAPDVKLEVLEWSTEGPALILLAGAARSAHDYENFAPYFTDRFRVIGITRRHHGASDSSDRVFGIRDLAGDVIAVMDDLSIERAFFMGHSFAGAEMSYLALYSPERAWKMVYLDGALDHHEVYNSDGWWDAWPNIPMEDWDKESPQSVAAYFARVSGVAAPLNEILSLHQFDEDGKLLALSPHVGTMFRDMIMPTLEPLDYTRFKTPILAVRSIPEAVEDLFGGYASYDPENQRLAEQAFQRWKHVILAAGDRFVVEVPGALELRIEGGSHAVFNVHDGQILATVRKFLLD